MLHFTYAFPLSLNFAVTTVQEARQIVTLPVLWHKRHSRLFIRWLLRNNDSGQPTKCQPTEERCWVARKLLLERQQRRGGRASWNIRFTSRTESLLKRLVGAFVTLAFALGIHSTTLSGLVNLTDDIRSDNITNITIRCAETILLT